MVDATYNIIAGQILQVDNAVGIQNQSMYPISYTFGTTFSESKLGIIVDEADTFPSSTIFIRSNFDCRITVLREV